jgi:hypothetical protein
LDENETKPIIKAGEVTGSTSDLRKLTMAQMQDQLAKLGVTIEHIMSLKRWDRVDLLRELANRRDLSSAHGELVTIFYCLPLCVSLFVVVDPHHIISHDRLNSRVNCEVKSNEHQHR